MDARDGWVEADSVAVVRANAEAYLAKRAAEAPPVPEPAPDPYRSRGHVVGGRSMGFDGDRARCAFNATRRVISPTDSRYVKELG